MRTVSLTFGKAAREKDSSDIKLLAPRRRCWWWDQSQTVKLEEEAISWLARTLTGVAFDQYDLEYSTDSFKFTDTEWDPALSLWYMAPRVVEWKPELKRSSYLLALQIVVAKISKIGPDETLASVTICAGVRRTDLWYKEFVESVQYETVWMYGSLEVPEWQREYFADDVPRSIWGPMNLADPKLRKYLPHRILLKKP